MEPHMLYRKLGSSGLDVSEISLGSWLTFGVGIERQRAVACVQRALDLGVNLIDTANVYGRGVSMAQFALAWVLRESNVASAIVGASRPER
jgi:aryl-alcohol dehydrogenase-like predicted oxidoreductase